MNIVFVCTGNNFRSAAAEYCLRDRLKGDHRFVDGSLIISSAGIDALPEYPPLHPYVSNSLYLYGIHTNGHVQTKLDQKMLYSADLVIGMGPNHLDSLRNDFNYAGGVLFANVAGTPDLKLENTNEVLGDDWAVKEPVKAEMHIRRVVSDIYDATPAILEHLLHRFGDKFTTSE